MKKPIIALALGLMGVLSYFLFENVFVWNFGWQPLPDFEYSNEVVSSGPYTPSIEKAREELKQIHQISKSPAVSIAVSIKGKIVWAEALGYKDLEKRIPASTETMFRIGSTSKALTSIALGKLLEENQIELDGPIQNYVPGLSNIEKISVRQLASHTSGIRNYGICFCFPIWEYYSKQNYSTVESSLEIFVDDPLLFQPGTEFSYSTYNYTLLSYVMEKASGMNFLDLMDQTFNKLDMHNTGADFKYKIIDNRSEFYDISKDKYKEAFAVDISNKWAGGGFISTPSDLVKAGNVLLDEHYLTPKTIEVLTTQQRLSNGTENEQGYALGWRNSVTTNILEDDSIRIIHHGGVSVGSQSLLVAFPEYRMSISLLINRSRGGDRFQLFSYLSPIARIFIEEFKDENS